MKRYSGLILITLFLTNFVQAGVGSKLLTTTAEKTVEKSAYRYTVNLSAMSKTGVKEYQSFIDYAHDVITVYSKDLKTSGLDNGKALDQASKLAFGLEKAGSKNITILEPKFKDGDNKVLLQHLVVDQNGELTRVAFELPSTEIKPKSIELKGADIGGFGSIGDIVKVKREFELPHSHANTLTVEDTVLAKKLSNGQTYRMVVETELTQGDKISSAGLSISGSSVDTRQIKVEFKQINPSNPDGRNPWINEVSGNFKLPEEIPGQVVEVGMNSLGNRLKFKTSEGVEYTYAISKKDRSKLKSNDQERDVFEFQKIGQKQVAGGVNSLLASTKIIKMRSGTGPVDTQSKTAAGLTVD